MRPVSAGRRHSRGQTHGVTAERRSLKMRILLVYPEFPETFWGFSHALRFISKRAVEPPLGLLTIAALLPKEWEKKLVHLEVTRLKDKHLEWADMVFVSAMSIQRESVKKVIWKCKDKGVKIVAGGPLFSEGIDEFEGVDHFVLDEAEITLPVFLKDLETGRLEHVYKAGRGQYADIGETPVPMWELINMKHYATMNIQYSRGCPFNCDFCSIATLFGSKVRTKNTSQMIAELDRIYDLGWRGGVFIVDDNFIGNKQKLKKKVLPALVRWMNEKKHPFTFKTEVSINLADDDVLMAMMVKAGFDSVFVGIETPNEKSLEECNKNQNRGRDLEACVKKIQGLGLKVDAGFIMGFDSDEPSVFDRLVSFIQETGIVTAMVGLLHAPPGTNLSKRLKKEGRLIENFTGNNTDLNINFIPKIDKDVLIEGYKKVIGKLYSPKQFYERVRTFVRDFTPMSPTPFTLSLRDIKALVKSMARIGIAGKERLHYWRLFFWTLFHRPKLFPTAITCAIYGYHFRKIYETSMPRAR